MRRTDRDPRAPAVLANKLLYFLPVALAACALSFWKVADPDVFWHLEAGLVMLDQGRLITHNFSSLFPDHLLSYIFLGLVVLLVTRRERSPRGLLALPPLFALWGNTHPEVASGLLYLGVVIVGQTLDTLTSRPVAATDARRLRIVALLCAGATLLNPWGYRILLMPLESAALPERGARELDRLSAHPPGGPAGRRGVLPGRGADRRRVRAGVGQSRFPARGSRPRGRGCALARAETRRRSGGGREAARRNQEPCEPMSLARPRRR